MNNVVNLRDQEFERQIAAAAMQNIRRRQGLLGTARAIWNVYGPLAVAGALALVIGVANYSTIVPKTPESLKGDRLVRPAEHYSVFIMKAHQFGCRNRSTFDRLVKISGSRDYAAVSAILNSGECFIWRGGTRMRVEERASSLACFAEFGTTKRCYWSQSTAVEELRR